MSFYATISARLFYEDDETFRRAVSLLENNGYLGDEEIADWIVDETGERMTESPNIDRGERTIEIPLHLHRNLARLLDEQKLFRGGRERRYGRPRTGAFPAAWLLTGRSRPMTWTIGPKSTCSKRVNHRLIGMRTSMRGLSTPRK